ncbi:hypothetical protein [Sphingomonas profundi]|uniref:hypothetical protein n=1 Tax=Alterirhizorhabdus profundi TaxID=2681549 RepID=UPI0018D19700|nr:hypothetical protein [Sphingomonas profundi]
MFDDCHMSVDATLAPQWRDPAKRHHGISQDHRFLGERVQLVGERDPCVWRDASGLPIGRKGGAILKPRRQQVEELSQQLVMWRCRGWFVHAPTKPGDVRQVHTQLFDG